MNEYEEQYLKTMIETLKYDDEYENRDSILTVLRNSIIKFNPTGHWGNDGIRNAEDIVLRVPIPMIKESKKFIDTLTKLAFNCYMENDSYTFGTFSIKPKPIDFETNIYKEHDVVFDEIKKTIIQGIKDAKYTIWCAVAWFTDQEIFNELLLKKNKGLNIRIITSNEPSNQYLMTKLENNFEVKKIDLRGSGSSNRLHDKFCIIDFEYVMHGSYNWSKNANGNDETWETALDRDFVKKFADEFIQLYLKN